jgi:hypothetical protein
MSRRIRRRDHRTYYAGKVMLRRNTIQLGPMMFNRL